jgi:hypothetical protein
VDKIKKNLIEKAKLKKKYAKVRERELADARILPQEENGTVDGIEKHDEPAVTEPASLEPHPDRLTMMNASPSPQPEPEEAAKLRNQRRRQRPVPFAREVAAAQKRKEEAEARRKAREQAEQERQRKIAERERFRKAMAKARAVGPNGQRRLGRESKVLLQRVKQLVGE